MLWCPYYPHYHPLVFQDDNTVHEWLLKRLKNHTMTCVSCLCDHPHSSSCTYGVEYMAPSQFSVATSSANIIISVNSIESAAFTFCHLIKHLLSGSIPTDNWLEFAWYILCEQPSWLFCSEEHYLQALTELSVPVLIEAFHALGLTGRLHNKKHPPTPPPPPNLPLPRGWQQGALMLPKPMMWWTCLIILT